MAVFEVVPGTTSRIPDRESPAGKVWDDAWDALRGMVDSRLSLAQMVAGIREVITTARDRAAAAAAAAAAVVAGKAARTALVLAVTAAVAAATVVAAEEEMSRGRSKLRQAASDLKRLVRDHPQKSFQIFSNREAFPQTTSNLASI